MEWSPWISDAIAFAALVVSVWAILSSRKTSKRQDWIEDQLREFQIDQVQAARQHAAAAQIELICYTREELTIYNAGGADARDVSVVCRCPEGRSALLDDSVFPLDRLEAGRRRRVRLVLAMGCYFPLPATVTWTDPDGASRTDSVTLNLE